MVTRNRQNKKLSSRKRKSYSLVILFWLVFAVFLLGLYIINREAISNSVLFIRNEVSNRNAPAGSRPIPQTPAPIEISPPPAITPVAEAPPPAALPPIQPAPTVVVEHTPPERHQITEPLPEPERRPAELRDRALYFIQVDRSGTILRVRVDRRLPISETPLMDTLNALIAGPNADEGQRGLISLIPPGTRILSTTVRGSTAYINFNEDFQINTFGVEGYAAQLRQVVFTATEFPNVRDVQILIEGRRVDFLGEGIWIGSPLSRDML